MEAEGEATINFACPRCGAAASDRFYGPCPPCRDQLRAVVAGRAREVEVERFEPAPNVVPNQVATKE